MKTYRVDYTVFYSGGSSQDFSFTIDAECFFMAYEYAKDLLVDRVTGRRNVDGVEVTAICRA